MCIRDSDRDIFADPTDSDDGKCKGSTTEAHLPAQEIPAYPPNNSQLTVQPPRGPKAPSAARVRGGQCFADRFERRNGDRGPTATVTGYADHMREAQKPQGGRRTGETVTAEAGSAHNSCD